MSDDYQGLTIEKGGRLIKSSWNDTLGTVTDRDISTRAIEYLFDYCRLDKGVTLRDILLLLKNNLPQIGFVLKNWTEDIIEEGLNGIPTLPLPGEEIEYLELYYIITKEREYENYKDGPKEPEPGSIWEQMNHKKTGEFTGHKKLQLPRFPDFHGVGVPLKEGDPFIEQGYKEGQRINFGVSLTPVCDLAHIPVILNEQVCICDDIVNSDYSKDNTEVYDGCAYTLGGILYAITWELSWHGGPKERNEVWGDLKSMVDEIKKDNNIE